MARRSSIKGDFKLRRLLRQVGRLGESDLPPALQKSANLVLETQQALIPRDTGAAAAALRVSITKANQQSGLDARIGIIGKKDNRRFYYLRFVEYGTKGQGGALYHRQDSSKPGGTHTNNRDKSQLAGRRNALKKRPTKNKSDGQNFFGYFPDIPYRPAHPWLRPSIDMNRDQIRQIISAAISSTLARAAQGVGNG